MTLKTTPSQRIDSSHVTVNTLLVQEYKKSLTRLTLPFKNEQGQTLQLWKVPGRGMFGTVLHASGKISIIPKDRIYSAISSLSGDLLMERIEQISLRMWALNYIEQRGELSISPYLIAAGRYDCIAGYREHLTRRDLDAAADQRATGNYCRNKKGELLLNRQGKPYNHMHEVEQTQTGVLNKIHKIKWIFEKDRRENNLTPGERAAYQKEISELSKLLDYSEKYYPRRPVPAVRQFHEKLQKTNLTKSYNASNPEKPAPGRGTTQGQIGGVGCSVEFIQGLFDSPDSLFECEHQFFIPQVNGESIPFSNEELRQLLIELAEGIYVFDTVPFFSLHFCQEGLYPVIHPAYQNTLVGQVISMLDYDMKGYLNGAVFKEEFIYLWQHQGHSMKAASDMIEQMIDLDEHAQTHLSGNDKNYLSVRTMLKTPKENGIEILEGHLNKFINSALQNFDFSDYSKFSNSFRIIAKQKKIEKSGSLFVLNSDFDVFYTIEPNPEYKLRLAEYLEIHGEYPMAYQKLIAAYDLMKIRIHDHMTKMPLCRKYFAMLGVINFFSHYFMTLKKHRKFPILPNVSLKPAGAPILFPSLPIFAQKDYTLSYRPLRVMCHLVQCLVQDDKFLVLQYLGHNDLTIKNKLEERLKPRWLQLVWEDILANAGTLEQYYLKKDEQYYLEQINRQIPFDAPELLQQFYQHSEYNAHAFLNSISTWGIGYLDNEQHNFAAKLSGSRRMALPPQFQTYEDREISKKIVGGCGIRMESLPIQASPDAPYILNCVKDRLSSAQTVDWIALNDEDAPKGALFKLNFDDLPIGGLDFKEDLQSLLVEPPLTKESSKEEEVIAPIDKIRNILFLAASGDREAFLSEIHSFPVENLKDYQGCNLLHRAAHFSDPYYLEALLRRGVSPAQPDELGYLPIHYAAMSGHVPHIKLLFEADKETIRAKSKEGATPLLVAVQHEEMEAIEFILQQNGSIGDRTNDGYTVLHSALLHGNEGVVRTLLEKSSDGALVIYATTFDGVSPLMLGCESGNLSLVKILLEHKASAQIISKKGLSALDIAIRNNDFPLCEILYPLSNLTSTTIDKAIKKGSLEINKLISTDKNYRTYKNKLGDNAVLMSLRYGNIPTLKYLLSNWAAQNDLNVVNLLGETPVLLAAKGGFYDILMELLNKGALASPVELVLALLTTHYRGENEEINGWIRRNEFSPEQLSSFVAAALEVGNYIGVSEIFGAEIILSNDFQSPLGWKVEHYLAKSDALLLLRQHFINNENYLSRLDQDHGKTLAYIAAENRSWKVLRFLLDKMKKHHLPLECHYLDRHLFYSVFESGDKKGIQLIMDQWNDPAIMTMHLNEKGIQGIHLAVKAGSEDLLEYLLNKGANFASLDGEGCDPLYYAVRSHNQAAVHFLLDRSLPISTKTLFAAAHDERQLNELLLRGANINEPCPDSGNTPIILAAKEAKLALLNTLLRKGASLSVKNKAGWTPLLYAALHGNLQMIKLILSHVNNPQLDCVKGENALHLATRNSHIACMKLLMNHGFNIDQPDDKGVTPRDHASKFFAGRAAIAMEPDAQDYGQFLLEINRAITEQNVTDIYDQIERWKVNTYFPVHGYGEHYEGTLLHILLNFCKECDKLSELIHAIISREKFNAKLKDSLGNSYAHLLVSASYDPSAFDKLRLDEKNNDNITPLHIAAQNKRFLNFTKLVDALVHDLDPQDSLGETPLFYAISNNHVEFVRYLATKPVDLNHTDDLGLTPLILACSKKQYPIVRILIKNGADINKGYGPNREETPLLVSLQSEKMARFLLFQGAKVGSSISHSAAQHGKTSILRLLAEKGVSLQATNKQGLKPIHAAVRADTKAPLAALQEMGVPIHSKGLGFTPLYHATMQGNVDAVKWLMENRANPVETDAALKILALTMLNGPSDALQLIELFKEYVFSTDLKQLLPAIQMAIERDYAAPLKLLYEIGISPNSKINDLGYSGLHLACLFGSLQCTEFFLTSGVECHVQTFHGETPLEFAAANKSVLQFKMILKFAEADLNRRNQKGETLLHISVRAGNLGHAALLLSLGADSNIQDAQGQTALFLAAEQGNHEIVKLLMICGADHHLSTTFSRTTPYAIGNPQIRETIKTISQMQNEPSMTPLKLSVKLNHSLAEKICRESEKRAAGK